MAEAAKRPDVIAIQKERMEKEERELMKLRKGLPSVEDLLKSVPFMKSFISKMTSQVFKTDTLHIMHTRCMMEILDQLKLINENLENLLDAREDQQEQIRTSKKLSRDK